MKYDFDELIDRVGSGCEKWDIADGELPMWVADMDFPTAPPVRAAIEKRAAHGIFGYTGVPDAWNDAYIGWWESRHGYRFEREEMIFCTGVVAALSSCVRKLTTPAENVLILTPVYNIFYNSIRNNGRNVLECPLVYDGSAYFIDFADLEKKLSDRQTSLMILCNPHNPVGKIWDSETLAKIGDLCAKYGVTVISDEIHCDLTDPGKSYVPFASASETCKKIAVTCLAPSKAFNLAGLHSAAIVVSDPVLRHKVWRGVNTDEVGEPGAFGIDGTVAAFTEGGEWLDALREYLYGSKQMVRDFVERELPDVKLLPSEATYLLWLDVSAYTDDSSALAAYIRKSTGLWLSAGAVYGGNGSRFLRMNIACPRVRIEDGLNRLKKGLESFKNQ